ncbi:MAG TPA: SDR family oxidoreductase [Anaerolineae bacterium]|nr:SDR family oxidoreductase [Anaerolineae bacterium]
MKGKRGALHGQVALVTGAGKRIGRAVALALAGEGATVAVHYHESAGDAQRVTALIRRRGGNAEIFGANLSNDAERVELVHQVNRTLGTVRILINSAARFDKGTFEDTSLEEWDANFAVNLKAVFHLSQLMAAQQNGRVRGNIISFTDWRGLRPGSDHFAYTVTKAALIAMTEAMALALAPRIHVNALALGAILPPPGATAAKIEQLIEETPLKQFGSPRDVTNAVIYLLTAGTYITGAVIPIDGGRRLTR